MNAFQRVVDCVWIVAAHYIACWIRTPPVLWTQQMTTATAIAIVVFNTIAEFNGIYRPWRSERVSREIWELFTTWLFVPPLLFFLAFFTKKSADYSRVVSLAWFVGTPLLLIASRLVQRVVLRSLRAPAATCAASPSWAPPPAPRSCARSSSSAPG
ncbi:MAG TPA: hypothetical protein VN914_21770 [Polyangia bacterium]|nr:hypothetical protein [Polyangia bacterium]